MNFGLPGEATKHLFALSKDTAELWPLKTEKLCLPLITTYEKVFKFIKLDLQ
jgi:hypothetical protein